MLLLACRSQFPGYTSENLATKGVHSVPQRRFTLVAADHPIVTAISENAEKLQLGEIAMMPEGLVKISSGLYDSILPLVRTQVDSQIKVRDLSRTSVSVEPAEFSSWTEARSAMMVEAKRPLKSQMAAELKACGGDAAAQDALRADFAKREASIEHQLDAKQMEMHMELEVNYNFLGNGSSD